MWVFIRKYLLLTPPFLSAAKKDKQTALSTRDFDFHHLKSPLKSIFKLLSVRVMKGGGYEKLGGYS